MIVADYVRNDGRDLNIRPRINTRPWGSPGSADALAFLDLQPNVAGTRPAASLGRQRVHRADPRPPPPDVDTASQFTVNYTLAEANSTIGIGGR